MLVLPQPSLCQRQVCAFHNVVPLLLGYASVAAQTFRSQG
jgi:hypothetical protein